MIIMHLTAAGKREAVTDIAGRLSEPVKNIGYGELDRIVAGLYTGEDKRGQISLPPLYNMPELLIFANVADDKLDGFLSMYRETGLDPVPLKAVMTPYNAGWTVYELIEELKKESKQM